MLIRRYRPAQRPAVAAVELAFVLPLLLGILIGVWELGRIVHVQQLLVTAARDGARLAAQGTIINTTGAYTFIRFEPGSPPEANPATKTNPTDTPPYVIDAVKNTLIGAGITDLTGIQISFEFVEGSPGRVAPFQGLKNERFKVRVSLPYDNVRWTNLSLFAPNMLTVEVYWQMMVDDPFTLNSQLPGWNPSNP